MKKKTIKKTAPKKATSKKTIKKKQSVKNPTVKEQKPIHKEKRSEFRRNKDNGHPAYIYEKVGSRFKYIGITHASITRRTKNIRLEENPDPKKSDTAYILPYTKNAKTKRFSDKKNDWKFAEADRKKVNKIIKKSKKR